jgi:hypothetical protein
MRKATCFFLTLALFALAGASVSYAQVDGTVVDIQTGSFQDATAIRVRGIVTAIRGSETSTTPNGRGFWIQDPPSGGPGAEGDAWSGIFCFTGVTDPSLALEVGDSVEVVGAYAEFIEESELNMRDCLTMTGIDSSWTVLSSNAVVPAFKKLTTCVLAADGAANINQLPMEQWEGVLVELDSVRVKSHLAFNEWSVEEFDGDSTCVGPADTTNNDDKMLFQKPPVGTSIRFLRGVFDETFSEHKIMPRGDFDIIFDRYPAPTPEFAYVTSNTTLEIRWTYPLDATTAQNIANYSLLSLNFTLNSAVLVESTLVRLTTGSQAGLSDAVVAPERIDIINVKNVHGITMAPSFVQFIGKVRKVNYVQEPKSVSNDSSRCAGFTVCVGAVATVGAAEDYNSFGGQVFVENTGGGAKSGLFVFNTAGLANSVVRGDTVLVSGLIQEFNNKTEMGILDYVNRVGTKPVPGPDVVTMAQAHSEDYEGVLVKLNGPLVVRDTWPGSPFNKLPSTIGADTLIVDDMDGGGYPPFTSLDNGDTLCFVVGVMDSVRFTSPTVDFYRRILPRDFHDICLKGVTGIEDGIGRVPVMTRLDRNKPNPFNPKTTISFGLSKPGQTSLVIYDISGRAVRTLVKGTLKAGEYAELWDGRNDDGTEVSSGIYFYKLVTSGFEDTQKMVLLK